MQRDEIKRRIARMTGAPIVKRPNEITLADIWKWFGVSERLVRMHRDGLEPINDFWQVSYTQFFGLIDAGLIEIRYVEGRKTLVRLKKAKAPVKKTVRPYINFATMTLGID